MEITDQILNFPYKISPSQREAVTSDAHYLRIVAGAGAGKTETLTRRILYLLLVMKVKPSSIVAFTFTEKAAQTMKSRVYRRLQEIGDERTLRQFGEMYIGTIHGFLLRLLQDKFGYDDYDVLDENQEMAFLLRYGYKLGLGPNSMGGNYSHNCTIFLDTLSVVYGEMLDLDILESTEPDFYKKMKKYEEFLSIHRRLTFDYLSYLAVTSILEDKSSIKQIEYLIVDEFQDINLSQYRLVELIGENGSVFVVGDPRQSIYQWRGSNEKFFLDFVQNFHGAEEKSINENRRSGYSIIEVSNQISESFETMKYDKMEKSREFDGSVSVLVFENAQQEAARIADIIAASKARGQNYSDFGILFRSVNTSAQALIDEFRKRRIPYLVGGKMGLFKRDEAQALGKLMAWLSQDGFWMTNSYNSYERLIGNDLSKMAIRNWTELTGIDLGKRIEDSLETWKEEALSGVLSDYKQILNQLLVLLKYQELEPEDPYGAAIMANIGRFSSLLSDFESANRLGGKTKGWNLKSELKSLCWFLNAYAVRAYEEQQVDDISGIDAVNIMTIHQAKGLEWPSVFLPSMIKGRFPSSQNGKKRKWMISESLFDSNRYHGDLEDEKRLFYVSITRARDNVVLSRFSSMNGKTRAGSDFLNLFANTEVQGTGFILKPHNSSIGVNEDIITYSVKELIDYRRCPFHYRLSNQWSYIQGVSKFKGYGETMHSCLRKAGELISFDGMDSITASKRAFQEKFFLPYADEAFLSAVTPSIEKHFASFVNTNANDMLNVEEVETRIEFPIENVNVTGRVDVILDGGDALEVRDYKTSEMVITEEDSAFQVQLYALGLSHLGRRINKGSIASVEELKIKSVGVTYADLESSKDIAKRLIKEICARNFTGKISNFCLKCEYKKICKWGSSMNNSPV